MRFRELHPNIRLRIGVGFVQRLLSIMLTPLLVIHLATLYGAAAAGALTVMVAVAGVASNFLGGHLADVYGRRPLLVWGEFGATVSFGLLALANSPWWQSGPLTFVLFLAGTCLSNIATPAADAMVVDVSTPENRPLVYTVNYWSINLALTVGALLGGFLYRGHFFQLLVGAALLSTATTLVMWRWISESAPSTGRRAASGVGAMLHGYLTVARDRVFLRLLAAALLVCTIEMQIGYYIAVRLAGTFPHRTLEVIGSWGPKIDGASMLGVLRAVNAALVVTLVLLAGRALRRLPERSRLVAGIAAFTVGYMVWAVSDIGWVLIAAAVLLTVGEITSVPVKQAILADLIPAADRTKYMAAYALHVRVALLLASVCVTVGAFVPALGMSLLYGAMGLGAVLMYRSLLPVRAARRAEQEREPAATLAV